MALVAMRYLFEFASLTRLSSSPLEFSDRMILADLIPFIHRVRR